MNYYALKSIISTAKIQIPFSKPSQSFCISNKPEFTYIEPTFIKEEFEIEKPSVILVSAAGATGKSALAHVLSYELSMPLLDLSKHKPVGDSTLTGLVADSFSNKDLGTVFTSIGKGTYVIIIDGVDEGRAMVTEKAFEAFLDDITQRCKGATSTCFVLLGRTNVLEDCWLYLNEKGVSTGLVSIQPFDLDNAKKYIDTLTEGMDSRFPSEYSAARDSILNLLSSAFHGQEQSTNREFLPFIGYPPVLDAIATLLKEERDYHQLRNNIINLSSNNVEIELLLRISNYILTREKEQKVFPNILSSLIKDMPKERQRSIRDNSYDIKEQCHRIISFCLGKSLKMNTIIETAVNDKYEEQLTEFLPNHPFITKHCFRNAVFESFALATLMASNDPECVSLVLEYAFSHKHSYHLVYFLSYIALQSPMQNDYLKIVLGAAYEFRSSNMTVDVHVASSHTREQNVSSKINIEAEIEIEMTAGEIKQKRFNLLFEAENGKRINLGRVLSSTYIYIPCEVILEAPVEIELIAPVYIEAESIILSSKDLIVRNSPKSTDKDCVELVASVVNSSLLNIKKFGAEFYIVLPKKTGITYPIYQYVIEAGNLPEDSELSEKYLRLKRILVEFRAHSRGQLARFKDKIENERVLRNEIGQAILDRLIKDKILTLKNVHYFLDIDKLGSILGVSWQDLHINKISTKLTNYLKDI